MENNPVLEIEIKRAILNFLCMLRDKPETRLNYGICGNVDHYLEKQNISRIAAYPITEGLTESWPHCRTYFSPETRKTKKIIKWPVSSIIEYFDQKNEHTLWNDPRRIDLVNHMIKELERDLNGK